MIEKMEISGGQMAYFTECPSCGGKRNLCMDKIGLLGGAVGFGAVLALIVGTPVLGPLGLLGIPKLIALVGTAAAVQIVRANVQFIKQMAEDKTPWFICPKCGCTDIIWEGRRSASALISNSRTLPSDPEKTSLSTAAVSNKILFVDEVDCVACGECVEDCPASALSMKYSTVSWDKSACIGCEMCIDTCPIGALKWLNNSRTLPSEPEKTTLSTAAVSNKILFVDEVDCVACGECVEDCPASALSMKYSTVSWDKSACIGCEMCIDTCPIGALEWLSSDSEEFVDSPRKKPTLEEITRRVINVVGDQLGFDEDHLSSETDFVADLGVDSLDIVELGLALEEEFDIVIPEASVEELRTIGDVVFLIEGEL